MQYKQKLFDNNDAETRINNELDNLIYFREKEMKTNSMETPHKNYIEEISTYASQKQMRKWIKLEQDKRQQIR